MIVTKQKLNYINKLLTNFYLLQKIYIPDIYFFILLDNKIKYCIYIKDIFQVRDIIKSSEKNNQYYIIASLKKKSLKLYS